MILIANPSHDTDTAIDILFRSTTDRLASHCRSRAVPGSDLNWKRLRRSDTHHVRHTPRALLSANSGRQFPIFNEKPARAYFLGKGGRSPGLGLALSTPEARRPP